MLLSQAFNIYRREIRLKGQSPRTEETYLYTSKSLETFFKGDIDMQELTYETVRQYVEWLRSRKVSTNCIRMYLCKLRVVLTHMRTMGHEVLDPINVPLPKKETKVPQFLTPKEVNGLIKVARMPRDKALISFLYSTGLRVSEALRCDRSDVKEDFFTVANSKNSGTRLCFIDKRTRVLLDKYLKTRADFNEALFYTVSTSSRMDHQMVEYMFRQWRIKAGFTWNVHAHSLRHSFATDLNRNGADIYTIMKMMGHKHLSSTEVYLHLYDGALKESYSKYHKV